MERNGKGGTEKKGSTIFLFILKILRIFINSNSRLGCKLF